MEYKRNLEKTVQSFLQSRSRTSGVYCHSRFWKQVVPADSKRQYVNSELCEQWVHKQIPKKIGRTSPTEQYGCQGSRKVTGLTCCLKIALCPAVAIRDSTGLDGLFI